ncbi:hypothetical protein CDAR_267521 [Caerostris darwini]|uniref:Uncharacterized protein n=1 Tax=Caerostris darwini TaxID=1538125 RepID=A0AAV4TH17_9ARAC|nr:hypothetical protein CDAR_267521 [Caerostris darwini]
MLRERQTRYVMYGKVSVAESIVGKWFIRSKPNKPLPHSILFIPTLPLYFNLEGQKRPGRSTNRDENLIKTMIENNPLCTICESAEILKISKSAIHEP